MVEFQSCREIGWSYVRRVAYAFAPGSRPQYFREPWRYPTFPLESVPEEIAAAAQDSIDVLLLPMNDWHTRLQRSHQLALALSAAGCRCFYFSPQLGYEYPKPYLLDPQNRVGVLAPGVFEVHVRVPAEHVFDSRLLTAGESRRVADAITRLRERFHITRAVQILSLPIWLDAAREAQNRHGFPLVYDCHDHLAGFGGISAEVVAQEPAVFDACDLAVFSAEPLMRSALAANEGLRSRAMLLRNAVDLEHFTAPRTKTTGKQAGRRKVAGYFGALDHWFNTEAVAAAARAHPSVRFVLIGRVQHRGIERLREHPNIEFTGEAAYRELPGHLAQFDIALIPFRVNDLTIATNPIKLYEYMSAGVPVVSSRLPEVEACGELVYLADTPEAFAAKVGEALAETAPERRERRIEFASRESWNTRARQLLTQLSALCGSTVCSER